MALNIFLSANTRRETRHDRFASRRQVDFRQGTEIAAPEDRARYLDDTCRENAELRSEVDGLLRAHEAAGVLSISPRTAQREWAYARAWLYRELTGGPGDGQRD